MLSKPIKQIHAIISVLVVTTYIFGNYSNVAVAAGQAEGSLPQTSDLCGGTGGNGQVVNVGSNQFTIKRNDDGRNQIIHLTNHATIKTSSGNIGLSKLKAGERVTLVGGPNQDGSFAADTVVLCSGPQQSTNAQQAAARQKAMGNIKKATAWSSYITVSAILLATLIWFGVVAFLRLKAKKDLLYILFFTIFFIYIVKVLDYTLFQFQSLILLAHMAPGLMLNGVTASKSLNLIPLVTLGMDDIKTSLLNILLMTPFGFGLPFITNFRLKKIVFIGMLFSIGIESLQFITGRLAGITFRIADINDVIFNTLGVLIGYLLFIWFAHFSRHIPHIWQKQLSHILQYLNNRPQIQQKYDHN